MKVINHLGGEVMKVFIVRRVVPSLWREEAKADASSLSEISRFIRFL